MNEEINKIIANLEGCIGIFDCLLTPVESNLLVLYIKELQRKNKNLEQVLDENDKLKIQISARETLCEEYEQLINTMLNFSFFKEECPLNLAFKDNSKE